MSRKILVVANTFRLAHLFTACAAIIGSHPDMDFRAVLSTLDDKMKTGKLPHQDMRPVRDLRPTYQGIRVHAPAYHRARNHLG